MYTLSLDWELPLPGLRLKGFFLTSDRTMEIQAATEEEAEEAERNDSDSELAPPRTEDLDTMILSGEYTWDALRVAAEYITSEKGKEGYCVSLSYRVTDWFECGLYYSVYYPDKDDKDGSRLKEQGKPRYEAWQHESLIR